MHTLKASRTEASTFPPGSDRNPDTLETGIMAICEHTPPPRPPSGGSIDGHAWVVDRRGDLVGLLCGPAERQAGTISASASVWLPPDAAEKVGTALLAAVAAWRGAQ